jgi:hypothetical protein
MAKVPEENVAGEREIGVQDELERRKEVVHVGGEKVKMGRPWSGTGTQTQCERGENAFPTCSLPCNVPATGPQVP